MQAVEPAVTSRKEGASLGVLGDWSAYLSSPIDGASLAVFRICFAVLILVNTLSYWPDISHDYIQPKFLFTLIPGLQALPEPLMNALFAAMATCAILIGLGIFYRPAVAIFGLTHTYIFLLEKSLYQNHLYLVSLLSILLFLAPADQVWSLRKRSAPMVPRWSVLALQAQIFVVYFFGGIAKLNTDWLRGEPQTTCLLQNANYPVLGPIFASHWFSQLVTYGGIGIDLCIGFLLFYRPTFWLGALLAVAFHVTNSILFKIGIFPWLMLATLGLFAKSDWPKRILEKFGADSPTIKVSSYAAIARKARLGQAPDRQDVREVELPSDSTTSNSIQNTPEQFKRVGLLNAAILIFLHAYFLVQLVVPCRRFLYPGDTSWTETGHRYSWSMMLRNKRVAYFKMTVLNPKTGETSEVQLSDYLNPRQIHKMSTKPDMIVQFAHWIANENQKQTGVRPIIKVRAIESLNFRPLQDLIDPNVDLAAQPADREPYKFVVPLASIGEKSGKTVDESLGQKVQEDPSNSDK